MENAWNKYSKRKKNEVFKFAEGYRRFISECKTERECVKKGIEIAEKHGFKNVEDYLKEDSVKMMVAFNGKARFPMEFPADVTKEEAEKAALENPQSAKWMEGFTVAKVIVVPGKMINVVLKK